MDQLGDTLGFTGLSLSLWSAADWVSNSADLVCVPSQVQGQAGSRMI